MATMTPLTLSALSDEEFRATVDNAVRGTVSEAVMSELKSPENANRCYMTLVTMKKNVEGQLAAKRADYNKQRARYRKNPAKLREVEERWLTWRSGALRFKTGVEELMVELREKRGPSEWLLRAERNELIVAYENLRKAIMEHRAHVCTEEECGIESEKCPADEKLWSTVFSE